MMQAEMASTSLASAGVRNSSFCDSGDAAALWACSAAARTAGQLAVAHVAPAAAKVRDRNCLRSSSVINVGSKNSDFLDCILCPREGQCKRTRGQNVDTNFKSKLAGGQVCDSN